MTYSQSVADQQTALNKQGANLKVDGLLGPLTQAAMSKYAPAKTTLPAMANAQSNFTNNFKQVSPTVAKYPEIFNSTYSPGLGHQLHETPNSSNGGGSTAYTPPSPTQNQNSTLFSAKTGAPIGIKATSPNTSSSSNKLPSNYQNSQQNSNSQNNSSQNNSSQNSSSNSQDSSNQSFDQNNPGLYGQLVTQLANQSQNSGADYKAAQAEAQRIQDEQTKLSQDYTQKTNNIAGTAGFLTQQSGLQGQLNNQYNTVQNTLGQEYAGATNRLGAANTQQGLLQQALSQAAGYAAPQFPSYTSAQFNPASNTYGTVGGGQYGSGPGAASNITSVQQAQTGINNISQNSAAITDNLTRAVNLAKSGNLDQNSPLLTGIQHAISNGLLTNQALSGFQSVISSLNSSLQSVGEPPIDINTITPSALAQLQQTIPNNLKTKSSSYQSFLNNFNGNSNSSSSSSSGGQPNPWH